MWLGSLSQGVCEKGCGKRLFHDTTRAKGWVHRRIGVWEGAFYSPTRDGERVHHWLKLESETCVLRPCFLRRTCDWPGLSPTSLGFKNGDVTLHLGRLADAAIQSHLQRFTNIHTPTAESTMQGDIHQERLSLGALAQGHLDTQAGRSPE